ncbi:NlpC/P60 family protein [Rhizobium sp. EC-SD404]|uniref:C40 family peptidase n=1 Tax=Rhizobium sp. EC-SD404 TaxID=2038389 RepID=UPI001256A95D|nr:NlpC/P60 family protein [Rhizobium sp. EC-SD404]VVT31667.1 NlpC/P60 family protein [Rhizobium sp. EC-SD404]
MLDRRLNAFRADLAEQRLKGLVEAETFTEGTAGRVTAPLADLRPHPDAKVGIDSQLLLGERVQIFDRANGFAWVRAELDGYVGYVSESAIEDISDEAPTHWVTALRTYRYAEPDMKRPIVDQLSIGSRLRVIGETEVRGTRYALTDNSYAVVAAHLAPIDTASLDHVAWAARFIETPYLWGGRSGFGIDCSGLVQMTLMMSGKTAPRDSDMQANALGVEIGFDERSRGDFVFWRGHVAILEDEETVIHANGHTMTVARETLADAITRIGPVYGQPTNLRRV